MFSGSSFLVEPDVDHLRLAVREVQVGGDISTAESRRKYKTKSSTKTQLYYLAHFCPTPQAAMKQKTAAPTATVVTPARPDLPPDLSILVPL